MPFQELGRSFATKADKSGPSGKIRGGGREVAADSPKRKALRSVEDPPNRKLGRWLLSLLSGHVNLESTFPLHPCAHSKLRLTEVNGLDQVWGTGDARAERPEGSAGC